MGDLLSIVEMAKKFGEPPQRLSYLIRKFNVKHVRVVGSTRMYDKAGQTLIKQKVREIRIFQD